MPNIFAINSLIKGYKSQLSLKDFESILENFPQPLLLISDNKKILFANNSLVKLLNTTKTELMGKKTSEIYRLLNKDVEIDELKPEHLSQKKLTLILPNQGPKYVDLNVHKMESPPSFLLLFTDVTDQKLLDDLKLDFVSIAAHELRTPLTSLKGYLYIYLNKYREKLNNEQLTFMVRMNISSQRLINIVENLLNVSRIEQGKMIVHKDPVDWIKNVKVIIGELYDQADDKNVKIEFHEPDMPIPAVLVDKFRINEVLVNLLSNAIMYTPSGGNIKVWFEGSSQEVITHIQDTGLGIPQDAIPKLFTKYFRVSGKLEQGSKGTGLGLYISKSIIDMHHGRIWVKSQLGKGSTFSFALPIAT